MLVAERDAQQQTSVQAHAVEAAAQGVLQAQLADASAALSEASRREVNALDRIVRLEASSEAAADAARTKLEQVSGALRLESAARVDTLSARVAVLEASAADFRRKQAESDAAAVAAQAELAAARAALARAQEPRCVAPYAAVDCDATVDADATRLLSMSPSSVDATLILTEDAAETLSAEVKSLHERLTQLERASTSTLGAPPLLPAPSTAVLFAERQRGSESTRVTALSAQRAALKSRQKRLIAARAAWRRRHEGAHAKENGGVFIFTVTF